MTHSPTTWTLFVWQILGAIDKGRTLDPDETVSHIDDGSLFEWLRDELGADYYAGLTEQYPDRVAATLEAFRSLANAVDARRKFGVEQNGLCLLVAYATEMAQQALSGSEDGPTRTR